MTEITNTTEIRDITARIIPRRYSADALSPSVSSKDASRKKKDE
tara:strand:- start:231 stop:362 length:132 start_codon:yes stop_codon:yes gene_type:complete